MLVLSGAVVAGIPQLDMESEASGSADQFENVEQVQAQQYIFEHYGNESEQRQRNRRTIQTVYVYDEKGDVLSRDSLLAGLRYQQDVTEDETVQAALHEAGIRGLENLVALRLADDRNASLDEQITALDDASDQRVERVVGRILNNQPRAQRFLPTGHGTATDSTDRRILVAFNASAAAEQPQEQANTALYETAQEYDEAGFFVLNTDAYNAANAKFFTEMVELVLPIALLIIGGAGAIPRPSGRGYAPSLSDTFHRFRQGRIFHRFQPKLLQEN